MKNVCMTHGEFACLWFGGAFLCLLLMVVCYYAGKIAARQEDNNDLR